MEPAQSGTTRFHAPLGRLALFLPLILCTEAMAQDAERGRRLFENQCLVCHQDIAKPGQKHAVTNLQDLRQRIQGWAFHMGEDWGKSEVDDVLLYLNSAIYRFQEPAR
ncbi:hypothetical protein [Methylococcus sp. EFPC2]|uniref:hypothetical protein n=1 Tax=Methylococcus sp. EFPC2 TaxID=2812648 RepID=UPI00196864C9|nr:hypothetical protein [Methylococcus sp. EFPC2]QSA97993.1 hypothetical protein JWZ97_03955 [Methylococcus sp. EFPC2]